MPRYFPLMKHRRFVLVKVYHGILIYRRLLAFGFWERLIALCKRCLKKVVGRRKLTFDELKVIIFEIESILNNRPLCYVYDGIDDIALTPNSLLFGRTLEQTNLVSNGEQTLTNYDITTEVQTFRKGY